MNNIDNRQSKSELDYRRKRIRRIKKFIIMFVMILILFPTVLCVILFFKLNSLEKNIDDLTQLYETEYNKLNILEEKSTIVQNVEEGNNIDDNIKNESNLELDNNKEDNNIDDVVEKREIYLTFDDGPSKYTSTILDILKEYNVKATFFVIGKTDENSLNMYNRIVEEGHTLGMHSYTHDYDILYDSLDDFKSDFFKLKELLYNTTGTEPKYYRFPGGSANSVSNGKMKKYIKFILDQGMEYIDWNVVNGDATSQDFDEDELIENVLEGIGQKDKSVVLMHDTSAKFTTVNSLSKLIEKLLDMDLEILPINEEAPLMQQIKENDI